MKNEPGMGGSQQWVLYGAALVLLVPSTLVGSSQFVLSYWGFTSSHPLFAFSQIVANPVSTGLYLYGLFCVWWMFFRFPFIRIRTIPPLISVGVFICGMAVVFFTELDLTERTLRRFMLNTYLYGGGPFLMVLAILYLLHRRDQQLEKVA